MSPSWSLSLPSPHVWTTKTMVSQPLLAEQMTQDSQKVSLNNLAVPIFRLPLGLMCVIMNIDRYHIHLHPSLLASRFCIEIITVLCLCVCVCVCVCERMHVYRYVQVQACILCFSECYCVVLFIWRECKQLHRIAYSRST